MSFDPYYKWLGIPSDEQPPHHYRLLGLRPFEPDAEVIDAAANRQMTYVQQCATGAHAAASQMLLNELSAARVTLLNPARKAAYDAKLRGQLAQADRPTSTARPALRSDSSLFIGWWTSRAARSVALGCGLLAAALAIHYLMRGGRHENAAAAAANTGGAVGPPPRDKMPADARAMPQPPEQRVRVRARIDGEDEIFVFRDHVDWTHGTFEWPSEVEVNQVPWQPNPASRTLLPPTGRGFFAAGTDISQATLEIVRGRGRIVVRKSGEWISVHVDDDALGSDVYEFVFRFPAPAR